ncbi:transporter substrate-binding domain-containing protein [uncultured Mailhella sp.]|uniref:transporter substrate-binding domain-containing protein n=1 Tax=uncultured Mailhella sp. TaxID=1981031 RepID=UPI003207E649
MKRLHRMGALLLSAIAILAISTSAPAATLPDDVQAIVKRGELRVGVKSDVPGFSMQDLSGEYAGMEVDLAKKIAEAMGLKPDKVSFTAVTAKTRGQLLDTGDIDMVLATFTITPERKNIWNFSSAYYTDAVSLLVKKNGGIKGYADLTSKLVGVAEGSTSKDAIIAAAKENGVTLTDTDNIQTFPDYPSIKAALDAGQVQAFCVDGSILSGYLDPSTEILTTVRFAPQEYGVATKLSNKGLAAFVEENITKWLSDGTIDKIIAEHNVAPSFKK